ncbi:cysteine desulfurase family protein [Fusibacter bizertensis]
MKKIYLDYAATTPVKEEVVSCMMPYFESTDSHEAMVRKTSNDFMTLLHASEGEFLFTSGGTHSDNALIRALAYFQRSRGKGNEIITSTIEHPAVYKLLEQLENEGFKIIYIPVSRKGILDIEALYDAVCDKTALVTVMMINNELGTRQPIEAIGDFLKNKETLFHIDAVQALGSTNIDLNRLHVDAASFSAHKIYAPKGCGAIYIKNKTILTDCLDSFFNQLCDVYDNIPYIVGFGKALTLSHENYIESIKHRMKLKEKLIAGMLDLAVGIEVNGLPLDRESHPGIVNFFVPQMDGDSMVINYDFNGIAISSGSACSSGALSASHVMKAIGYDEQKAKKCIRMTIGDYTTLEDIERVIEVTEEMLKGIKYVE